MSKLQELFISKQLTLSLAESCTGGLIASTLTKVSGSSAYFLGSFVTYCDRLKEEILGVDRKTLQTYSAVSKEVAREMCLGTLKLTKSDYAISVTGDAGPSGSKVGTVYGAIGNKETIYVLQIPDIAGLTRTEIQQKSADFLLETLYNLVRTGEIEGAYE